MTQIESVVEPDRIADNARRKSKTLIAYEPTTSLGVTIQEQVLALIRGLTHDRGEEA